MSLGRILAVADSYDAMTSSRPYRTAMPAVKAEEILSSGAGTQWDRGIVAAFFASEIAAQTKDTTYGEAIAAIDLWLDSQKDFEKLPGVVAVAFDRNGVIYEGGFGKRINGQPPAMTPDTVVWIASMTKAVTCWRGCCMACGCLFCLA